MPLNVLWVTLFALTALLAGGPALADDDDDDWEETYHYGDKKKGKGKDKKKGKNEPRYYIYYYVPREPGPPLMADCPPAPAFRPDMPSMPQAAPRAYGKTPGAFPRESQRERSLAGERRREILEKELATEQELLALAKRELAEQAAGGAADGAAVSPERLRPYMDNVELHEKNVSALRLELSRVHR